MLVLNLKLNWKIIICIAINLFIICIAINLYNNLCKYVGKIINIKLSKETTYGFTINYLSQYNTSSKMEMKFSGDISFICCDMTDNLI